MTPGAARCASSGGAPEGEMRITGAGLHERIARLEKSE